MDDMQDEIRDLLARIDENADNEALDEICNFFVSCDINDGTEEIDGGAASSGDWERLKRSQGLVILHIMQVARRNHEAGRQWLGVLKTKILDQLSTFPFALLLALSQTQTPFSDLSLKIAKEVIFQYLKDSEKRAGSVWVQSLLSSEADFEGAAKEIAETSVLGFGWEHALDGLYELGFLLIESHLTKVIILSSGKLTVESPFSAAYNACLLGKAVIYKCFSTFDVNRRQAVFDRLIELITTGQSTASGSALFFAEVLAGLVSRGITAILANEDRVIETFDSLPSLSSDIAVPMLKALLPAIKLSPAARDMLVPALKKAMFSRDTEARKIATGGLLLFLKYFKIMNAFKSSQSGNGQLSYWHSFPTFGSQVLSDSKSDPQRANYKRLCLEVIGCLRRTLSQQAEVKEVLYHGLCSVIRRNVSTLQPVVDFLYRHLQNYLEEDPDAKPPFKLKKCVEHSANDTAATVEPLGWLLHTLTRAVKQAEDDRKRILNKDIVNDCGSTPVDTEESNDFYFDYNKIEKVRQILWNLAKRVSVVDAEDFALDKAADYSASGTGEANVKMAKVLLSTYESCIAVIWSFYDYEPDSADAILALHDYHFKLKDILKEKEQTKGKKAAVAGGAGAVSFAKSSIASNDIFGIGDVCTVDLKCLYDMASQILCDSSPHRHAGLEGLRRNIEFLRWLLETILAKVVNLGSRRKTDTSKTFDIICGVSSLMLQFYKQGEKIVPELKREACKRLELLALEIVVAVMDVVSLHFPDKMEDALNIWDNAVDPQSQLSSQQLDDKVACYARTFQHRLKQLLQIRSEGTRAVADETLEGGVNNRRSNDENFPKHLSCVIKILDSVWKQLPPTSEHFKRAYAFLSQLCEEHEIREVAICRQLWQILLRMHRRMGGDGELAVALATDIRLVYGDLIDEDADPVDDPETKFKSVVLRTAASVTTALCSHLDEWREDCVFLTDHAKRKAMLAKSRKDTDWSPNDEKNCAICERLHSVGQTWQELIQAELPHAQVQTAMKFLQAYFDSCTALVRYYALLHQAKMGDILPRFVDFVRFLGGTLIPLIYKFVGHAKCRQVDPTWTNAKKKAHSAVAKEALREMKDVSSLVFAVETFEKCLIELSGKCKEKKLVDRMYFGHGRDFKINEEEFLKRYAMERDGGETEDGVQEVQDDAVLDEERSEEPERRQRENSNATQPKKLRRAIKTEGARGPKRKKKTSA